MISWEDFEKVEMRVGTILNVEDFPEARNPSYKLTIDFGPAIGTKRSSAQLVDNYTPDALVGRLSRAYASLPVGDPLEAGTLVGPLIDEAAAEAFAGALAQAKAEGGLLAAGGGRVETGLGGAYVALETADPRR